MRGVSIIIRIVTGLLFLVAGFLKIIDPVGSGLVVGEYLNIIGIVNLPLLSLMLGLILAITEGVLGISVLLGLRMNFTTRVLLGFISFFTLLTLYLAIYNPISDCGCFGEAIKLSNVATLYKNIFLLVASVLLFLFRNRRKPLAPAIWEWPTMGLYTILLAGIAIYSLRHLPIIDFTPFHTGADISQIITYDRDNESIFETKFIYEKDGEKRSFSIDSLPDNDWSFIDSETSFLDGAGSVDIIDFLVTDYYGNDVTDDLLSTENLFVTVIPYVSRLNERDFMLLDKINSSLIDKDLVHIVLCATTPAIADSIKSRYSQDCDIYFADFKTLIALNRSNGGALFLNKGVISAKWSFYDFQRVVESEKRLYEIINSDIELLAAERRISEIITVEVSLFALILLIIVMRFIFRIIYNEDREEI